MWNAAKVFYKHNCATKLFHIEQMYVCTTYINIEHQQNQQYNTCMLNEFIYSQSLLSSTDNSNCVICTNKRSE